MILPLKKTEQNDLITSLFMTRMTDEEKKVKHDQYFSILVILLFLGCFFVTEQQFYQMSVLFQKHAKIKYTVEL